MGSNPAGPAFCTGRTSNKEYRKSDVILERVLNWLEEFKKLPPVSRYQEIESFRMPSTEDFDLSIFPPSVPQLFEAIQEAKRKMTKVKQICSKHKVLAEDIENRLKAYRKLERAIKHPSEEVRGIEAIVFEENGKTVVSIPIDKAVENPSLFLELDPIPRIHRPEGWMPEKFERSIKKYLDEVRQVIAELKEAAESLSGAKNLLSKARTLLGSVESECETLEKSVEGMKTSLEKIRKKLFETCHDLRAFGFEPPEIKDIDSIGVGFDFLNTHLGEAEGVILRGVEDMLKEFPELARDIRDKGMDGVKGLDEMIRRERERMKEEVEKHRKMIDWIDKNVESYKRSRSMDRTIDLLDAVTKISKEVMNRIIYFSDLRKIVEDISKEIGQKVEEIYTNVMGETGFAFTHVGEGRFLSSVYSKPITHPGGSEKALVSMGIMMALAERFDLPLILDESLDRIGVERVVPFLEYISGVAPSIQICLVVCRTYDVEKNPEILPVLEAWKIYKVSKKASSLNPSPQAHWFEKPEKKPLSFVRSPPFVFKNLA